MTKYMNYFLGAKNSRLINGHLNASELYDKILNHDGKTAYCCYFDLDDNLLKLEWDTFTQDPDGKQIYEYALAGTDTSKFVQRGYKCNGKTFTQYEGIARPAFNLVSFDFDAPIISDSLADVRLFLDWLKTDNVAVFFSGSKGFHIMVPFAYFGLEESENLPIQLRDLAHKLVEMFPTLDKGIYNYNRKFRVPFTQHEKTGLYKTFFEVDEIQNFDADRIKAKATERHVIDFLSLLEFENLEPLEAITKAISETSRKNYEIEKERAGTKEKPSPFERFDNKLCIKKMLESRCDDVGRNNACIRIVNDFYRTGKPQAVCEDAIEKWIANNGLSKSEAYGIVSNIYRRHQNYNFGCQDECKSTYCSAKCDIWKKLDPDKRPATVDQPATGVETTKNPKEFTVVRKALMDVFQCEWDDYYQRFNGGIICKQGTKDLFLYKEGYWQHLKPEQIDLIKIKFNALFENALDQRKLDRIFKMFMLYVPAKPDHVDMFIPRSNVANFNNGTLHLHFIKGEYIFQFKEHRREDYITFKVDFDYSESFSEKNEMFENWLLEYLSGDEEQFNLVQEMFGASLVPTFPQFFVLLGVASTGKSTLIKVLKQMHGDNERNISKVAPHQFSGFNMQSMAGRLVNIVMDINTRATINDDVVKQIEDRDSMRIERKNQEDIYAPLPALHIFGANKMPKTFEGYSNAMDRRFSIINFDKVHTGPRNREISKVLFNNDPQGVVNFAVRGLMRLAIENKGFFSKSKKSMIAVSAWTKREDLIQIFMDELLGEGLDVKGEFVKLERDESLKISKARIWEIFNDWQQIALSKLEVMGRNRFYQLLDDKGYEAYKSDGIFYFRGFGELSAKDLGEAEI